jgi:anti-sigma regulatory factor (Ser/Thr protein kinase)
MRQLSFAKEDLATLRQLVAGEARQVPLSEERRTALTVAVNELAANSVVHGGGSGTLQLWREPDAVVAEVRDEGWIRDPLAGRRRPEPSQIHGRGLWMVNQLCDLVQVRSGRSGTRVRVRVGADRGG